jgi:hypothetical protein
MPPCTSRSSPDDQADHPRRRRDASRDDVVTQPMPFESMRRTVEWWDAFWAERREPQRNKAKAQGEIP